MNMSEHYGPLPPQIIDLAKELNVEESLFIYLTAYDE